MEELSFKSGNPGAVQFGNFINYYQFHPPSNRIAMLPSDMWNSVTKQNKRSHILDIGCNAGDLTTALYDFLTKTVGLDDCSILGVDIDPTLIERACEKNMSTNITYKCFDIMTETLYEQNPITDFLQSHNCQRFDITFCFSITMWIHLNHGDDGLKRFLKKVSGLSNFFLIEPQPWKCYKTAVKRFKLSKSEFPRFRELQIRQTVEEDIEQFILEQCGLEKVGESNRTEWGRKLLFFKRIGVKSD